MTKRKRYAIVETGARASMFVDATHHLYITRAMELGCDVISEKPMTTELPKLLTIFDAIERTGRSLRVTFNYRYAPAYTQFRQLVLDGEVGWPVAVDFSWILDTSRGFGGAPHR